MTHTASIPQQPTPFAALGRLRSRRLNLLMVLLALAMYGVISVMILRAEGSPELRFRVDLAPLLAAPAVLQTHVIAAVSTFVIGCVLLAGVKGRTVHRTLGYIWVTTMAVTAISSFFLRDLNPGSFSFIHALSAWTMIILPMGLAAARRRNVAAHRKHMTGLFMGGLVIAGLFSFLPGRMMWGIFLAA